MAKIKAHGDIIGTIEHVAHSTRYMRDGKILKNHGFGWKLAGTLKPGLTPQQAYETAAAKQNSYLAERPGLSLYRRLLLKAGGRKQRAKLRVIIDLMPDDPDGVWSEACDGYGDNVHADLSEIIQLCQAYKSALAEADEIRRTIDAAKA